MSLEENSVTADVTVPSVERNENLSGREKISQAAEKACSLFNATRDKAKPSVKKAVEGAKSKPWAAALALGVVGLAIIGIFKGRHKF